MTEVDNSCINLLENNIDFYKELEDDIEEANEEDVEIIEPFDPTKIRVVSKSMTIDLVLSRIKYNEIDLAPEFQRHADIWTNDAKSLLIESILIRIPLPAFYMDATNEDKWLVIDGLQRLTTLKQFVTDQVLKLSGLEYLVNLQGKTYEELPRNYQRRIQETEITIYTIEKGTPDEVKFNIFSRINTGGKPLSKQELRHALNPGKAPQFLAKLAELPEFTRLVRLRESRKKRMEDREFVLRCLAFLITPYEYYHDREKSKSTTLDGFLNETMSKLNQLSSLELQELENKFLNSMKVAYEVLGENAFKKDSKLPLNKALFEAWSVNLSRLNDEELNQLKQHKKVLLNNYKELLKNDKEFDKAISEGTSSRNSVRRRFSKIRKLILDVLE